MYCNRCGKEIKPEWKHCRYCGAENGSVKSSGKQKKVTMLLMAIVSILLISSGIFFAKDHFKKTLPESSDSLFLLSEGFTDRKVVDSTSARAAIEDVADALHIQNLSANLGKCQENTALGISYYQFQQNYNDIPVYGRSFIVSANGEGKAVQLLGNYTKLDSVDLDPLVSEEQAFDIVRACYGPEIQILSEGLTIYSLLNSSPELTWQFYVGGNEAELCFISAKSGNIVGTDSLLYTETVEGLGLDKDGNEQRFLTEKIDGLYYLKDVQRNSEIFDANGGSITRKYSFVDSEGHTYQEKNNKLFNEKGLETKVVSENGQFVFYDLNDRLLGSGGKATLTLYPPNIFTKLLPVTNKSTEWKQQNAVTLMSRVATAYDFWEQTLGRKSFDGTGGEILVIYRENNEETGAHNAFSTGFTFNLTNLSFGAQNSLSLDTVAHEFTHSVESSISNMKYEKETGAIKEALSDIFGELTESWANGSCDWNHGKRNLKSPKANRYPDYYGGTYWIDPSTNSDDNGGVHTNLTVLSHAAYLMWNGIDGSGLFAKLSTDKLAQLFYLSMYSLPSDCTFSQFSNVVENTARIMCNQSMLTEDEYKTISYAFFQVGIVPAIMPVAKETKVNVYDLHGVAYSDYTLTINGHGQSQSYSAAEIEKNGLRFSDIGDYELVVIDNKTPNNEKRITVTVVERGGKNILPIYTRCGTGDIIALLQHLFGKDSEAVPKDEHTSSETTPTLGPVNSPDSHDQASQSQLEVEADEIPESDNAPQYSASFIMDVARVLTEQQRRELDARAAEISRQTQCSVSAVTVDDYRDYGSSVEEAAETLFDRYHFGTGMDRSTILLLLSMAERDYDLYAHGALPQEVFSEQGMTELADAFLPALSDDHWALGIQKYLDKASQMLQYESGNSSVGLESDPETQPSSGPQSGLKHYYELFANVTDTWEEAERYCESIGGHLATITSPEENAEVFKLAKEYGAEAYLGLYRNAQTGTWEWITGEPVTYLNWAYGQPDNANAHERYAQFYYRPSDGTWVAGDFGDDYKGNRKSFICEWDSFDSYTRHYHTVFGGAEFETALDDTRSTINSAHNNVINNSLIASAGDRLYFFHDMLWTGNSDLSEAEEIGITNGSTISTDGNHLYFISGGINKYDTTRTGQYGNYEKIPFDNPYCDNLMLEKDWLYYIGIDIDSLSFSGPIWRIKTDNSVKECIYEGRSYCFNIYKGKVYFSNSEDDYCIYRMDLDGSNIEKLSTQGGVSIVIEDDWIYYLTDTTHQVLDSHFKNEIPVGKIYKMRLDGSENIKIRDGQAGNLNVWKGYLYYTCYEDGQTIHRISVNGTDDRILTNKRECSDICICNDMIFFKSKVRNLHGAYETHVMHMYLDGSDFDIPLHKERPVVEAVEKAADVIQAHLTAQFTGSIQPSFVQHTNSDDKLYIPVIERIMALSAKNSCWGMLYDVDGDSINELLVLYMEKGGVSPSQVYAEVFSIRNGEAVSIMETAKINHDLGGEHGAFGVVEYGGEKYLCSYYNSGYSGPDAWDVARTRLFDPRTGNPVAEFESKAFNEYDSGAVNITKVNCTLNGKEVSKEEYDMWISQIQIVQLIDRKDNRYSLALLLDAIS